MGTGAAVFTINAAIGGSTTQYVVENNMGIGLQSNLINTTTPTSIVIQANAPVFSAGTIDATHGQVNVYPVMQYSATLAGAGLVMVCASDSGSTHTITAHSAYVSASFTDSEGTQ